MRQNTSATADILDFHTQHSALTLTDPRQPEQRLVGVCHHFMLFLVSMLRARGVPARARCGFGAYLPRDQFLIAADAWTMCRTGRADPTKFGIFKGDLRGLWFIATDLIHDLAALNNVELLPWDVWGAMPQPNTGLNNEQLAFFDELARLTSSPDANFVELRELFQNDERVRIPPVVFNALLQREESVE